METLLNTDFIAHYVAEYPGLRNANVSDICQQTNAESFQIEDNDEGPQIVSTHGTATYTNANKYTVTIIAYETFIKSLPSKSFKKNRKICDLIIYTESNRHFLLNELTETCPKFIVPYENQKGPQPGKRADAKIQLLSSLTVLLDVPSIRTFTDAFADRRCCFFSKQALAPSSTINATNSFGRINDIAGNGMQMSHPEIERQGFYYYEHSGGKALPLN